jgi:AraC-like DNA-binding protein
VNQILRVIKIPCYQGAAIVAQITPSKTKAPLARPDRKFYATAPAFGRFGMRWFSPQLMSVPHSHGHVEFNWLTGGKLDYLFNGQPVVAPSGRLVLFWAGVSHQAVSVPQATAHPIRQCNIYLPLDSFLYQPKLGGLTEMIMGGGVVALAPDAIGIDTLQRWYGDYRSGNADRADLLKNEIGLMLKRASLTGWDRLLPPWIETEGNRAPRRATALRHIVAMVRHIMEHLGEPLDAASVAAIVGLHPNYALNLFTEVMQVPIYRFVLRMRLIRARELLFTSTLPVHAIAYESGFTSVSQFYVHFRRAYGVTPHRLRREHL